MLVQSNFAILAFFFFFGVKLFISFVYVPQLPYMPFLIPVFFFLAASKTASSDISTFIPF